MCTNVTNESYKTVICSMLVQRVLWLHKPTQPSLLLTLKRIKELKILPIIAMCIWIKNGMDIGHPTYLVFNIATHFMLKPMSL